jgi:two-component system, OmpR family, phosphate regulon sensor histidine kinase PhoR
VTFRTRTFLSVFIAASLAIGVSTVLVEFALRSYLRDDIERGLLNETRLAASLLTHRGPLENPDAEADALGHRIGARVTFIDRNGVVLGDSEVDVAALPTLENHAGREEMVEAAQTGEGIAIRRSHTTAIETLYSAVAVRDSPVAFVRLALPLTVIDQRVSSVRRLALIGLLSGLIAALVLTWLASVLINRRISAVADTAKRYRDGDFTRPARDYGRDEVGIVANVLDDTARQLGGRLADMARERAHTDAILTGMAEGVLLVNGAGRLVLTNPAGRKMLRLPDNTGDTHYVELVRHPDVCRLLATALAGERPASVEVQLDQDPRHVFVAHVVPVAAARGGGAVLVLRDITDLRRADQVRRDFVANVSHELRTPLTAIRGYVEALQDGPGPDDTKQFLGIIDRHSLRMERLVSDLLRLARLDAGQEVLTAGRCDIREVLAGVEHDLEGPLKIRRQIINVAIEPGADLVQADPAKLADVVRNLLENASNYSPEASAIDIRAAREHDAVLLTISDRGPGIPETDLTRIFERFYRVDRSRTRDPGGTGLGLSIVRHLVELMGGRVSAANREGGGAVFTVALPGAPTGA